MGTGMGMDEREALVAIEHVRDVLQGASALIARDVIGDDDTGTVVETIGYAIDRAWRDLDDALYAFDRAGTARGRRARGRGGVSPWRRTGRTGQKTLYVYWLSVRRAGRSGRDPASLEDAGSRGGTA